jgi:hypothetical protein
MQYAVPCVRAQGLGAECKNGNFLPSLYSARTAEHSELTGRECPRLRHRLRYRLLTLYGRPPGRFLARLKLPRTLLHSLFTPQNRMGPRLRCCHAVWAMLMYWLRHHRRRRGQHTHATDAGASRQRPAARPRAGAREGGASLPQSSPARAWQQEAGAGGSL